MSERPSPPLPPSVQPAFDAFPPRVRERLLELRDLIHDVATEQGVAPLTESLKWGQPSYASKRGTPIRLGFDTDRPGTCSLYVHCQTSLVQSLQLAFPGELECVGTREVVVPLAGGEEEVVRAFVGAAVRYREVKGEVLLGM